MKRFRSLIDFVSVAAPKAVGGLCLVVANLWLMSSLPPELFGVYTLALTLLVLLSEGLFGAAIDMAVLRLSPLYLEHDPERAIGIERAALTLKLQVMGSVALVLSCISMPLGRILFQRTDASHLIVLVCIAAIAALMFASGLLHLQVRNRFWQYGALDSLNIFLKFGGIAAVLLLYADSKASISAALVLVWFAVGPAFALAVFWLASDKSLFELKASGGQSSKELNACLKWIFATLLVSSLVAKMDVLLLALFGTMGELGIYAGGQSIASIPLLIGSYMGIVLNPKVMPYCRAGKFYGLLRDVQLPLFVMCIAAYGFVFLFQSTIKESILPFKFQASADIILILLPSTLAGMTSFPLAIAFLMFVAPRLLISLECILLPVLLIAYLIMIPLYGAWGAAVVTSVAGLVKTLVAQWMAFRMARKTPLELGMAITVGFQLTLVGLFDQNNC
jgi:O-antigen/teichoic acid export membrane protein